MKFLLIATGILIFMVLSSMEGRYRRRKKLRRFIKEQFGKKPDQVKNDYEKIGHYWDVYAKSVPEDEKIDSVTWNDLEMDDVFLRINSCNSFVGEQVLYSYLHCLPKNNFDMEKVERKICFFSSNEKQREEIQLLLCGLRKDDHSYYLPKFLENLDAFKMSAWKYRVMQIFLIISVLPAIVFQNMDLLFIMVPFIVNNLIVFSISKDKYETQLDTLFSIGGLIVTANKIATNDKLLYENTFHDLNKEVAIFRKISYAVGIMKSRKNASLSGEAVSILYSYLIGVTLWDFTKYDQILRILKKQKSEFNELYKRIGEIDMAIAIASFRKSLPFFCTPEFIEGHKIKMEKIYHPLIDNPVCNSVTIDKNCIITGSNASGKSTFIKAVAVNMILAHCINTCMARNMSLPFSQIITSMAVRDDLMAGESYYIKEIKYLKRIIESLSENRFIVCTIDEILRGTNTKERIAASAAILRYLSQKNCIAIVASHDIELTRILDEIYVNYHFNEQMKDDDITFDYTIYNGASTSSNAIKLLDFIGFPEKIIKEAVDFLD